MSVYVTEDGRLGLQINANAKATDLYHKGRRTLIHLPVEWVDTLEPKGGWPDGFERRAPEPGDEIGLYRAPFPRVRVTDIESIEIVDLHAVNAGDLGALGRQDEEDLEGYKESWDQCWGSGERAWPWEKNPKVYAIRWKPIGIMLKKVNNQ